MQINFRNFPNVVGSSRCTSAGVVVCGHASYHADYFKIDSVTSGQTHYLNLAGYIILIANAFKRSQNAVNPSETLAADISQLIPNEIITSTVSRCFPSRISPLGCMHTRDDGERAELVG